MSQNPSQSPTDRKPPIQLRDVFIRGVWWPKALVDEQSVNAVKNFEVRDDDVWIATWPKAGTHWVAEICHLVNHNGDLDAVDRAQNPMPLEFAADPSSGENRVPRYKTAPSWASPRVMVTHVPKSCLPDQLLQGKGKVISVIRNLKDSINSYYYFVKGMTPGNQLTFKESLQINLYGDKVHFSSWFDHVAGYLTERGHNKQYLFLKFEDMKTDTRGAIVQIADFLGRSLSDEKIDKIVGLVTVKSMKTRYNVAGESSAPGTTTGGKVGAPNLMRKGVVGDWKNTFTVAQSEAFDEYYQQKMEEMGLKL